SERMKLDLTDALARDAELGRDGVGGVRYPVGEAVPELDHAPVALRKPGEPLFELALPGLLADGFGRVGRVRIREELDAVRVLACRRLLERGDGLQRRARLVDLLGREADRRCELRSARFAAPLG